MIVAFYSAVHLAEAVIETAPERPAMLPDESFHSFRVRVVGLLLPRDAEKAYRHLLNKSVCLRYLENSSGSSFPSGGAWLKAGDVERAIKVDLVAVREAAMKYIQGARQVCGP